MYTNRPCSSVGCHVAHDSFSLVGFGYVNAVSSFHLGTLMLKEEVHTVMRILKGRTSSCKCTISSYASVSFFLFSFSISGLNLSHVSGFLCLRQRSSHFDFSLF